VFDWRRVQPAASAPMGSRAAAASSSAKEEPGPSPKSRRAHCSTEPVDDWPPSAWRVEARGVEAREGSRGSGGGEARGVETVIRYVKWSLARRQRAGAPIAARSQWMTGRPPPESRVVDLAVVDREMCPRVHWEGAPGIASWSCQPRAPTLTGHLQPACREGEAGGAAPGGGTLQPQQAPAAWSGARPTGILMPGSVRWPFWRRFSQRCPRPIHE
jgi:hypothetical protein